jgi:hypothetical protein
MDEREDYKKVVYECSTNPEKISFLLQNNESKKYELQRLKLCFEYLYKINLGQIKEASILTIPDSSDNSDNPTMPDF